MWEKVKAFCLHSLTMALGYVLGTIGIFFQLIDASSYLFNSQDFKDWLNTLLHGDTIMFARIMMIVSALVILARLRGIMGWGEHKEEK